MKYLTLFRKLTFLFAFIFVFGFSNAATVTATNSGAWSTPANWDIGVPVPGDIIIIPEGITITILGSTVIDLTDTSNRTELYINGDLRFNNFSALIVNENNTPPLEDDFISVGENGSVDSGGFFGGAIFFDALFNNGQFYNLFAPTQGGPVQITAGGVLPIELVSFTAQFDGENVVINWVTSKEFNVDYLELEKSVDGKTFYSLDKIEPQGVNGEGSDYEYIDINPFKGTTYYRLHAVDLDGYEEFFFPIWTTVTGIEDKISYFPNPFNGQSINYTCNFKFEEGVLRILNRDGIGIMEHKITEPKGAVQLQQTLPKGVYFVSFTTENYKSVTRIVKE